MEKFPEWKLGYCQLTALFPKEHKLELPQRISKFARHGHGVVLGYEINLGLVTTAGQAHKLTRNITSASQTQHNSIIDTYSLKISHQCCRVYFSFL